MERQPSRRPAAPHVGHLAGKKRLWIRGPHVLRRWSASDRRLVQKKSRLDRKPSVTSVFHEEVAQGQRFTFGKNWASFLSTLNDERIRTAEKSLQEMLEVQ